MLLKLLNSQNFTLLQASQWGYDFGSESVFVHDFGCVSGEPLPQQSSLWTELVTSCPSWPCLARVQTGTWVSRLKISVRRSADGCRSSSRTWSHGTPGPTAASPTRSASVCSTSLSRTEWRVLFSPGWERGLVRLWLNYPECLYWESAQSCNSSPPLRNHLEHLHF